MLLNELVDGAVVATLQCGDRVLELKNASARLIEVRLLALERVAGHRLVLFDELDARLDKKQVCSVSRDIIILNTSRSLAQVLYLAGSLQLIWNKIAEFLRVNEACIVKGWYPAGDPLEELCVVCLHELRLGVLNSTCSEELKESSQIL